MSHPGIALRRHARLIVVLLSLLIASCVGMRALAPLAERTLAERSELKLDLNRPDALIESASLKRLPRDLLAMPLLRDTLTEDLVFYYEGNADRLGLTGALRRIAFEHELQLTDDVIAQLLDQPAEIALWRGTDGKLAHVLLSIRRGKLAKLLQPLVAAAASDTQLTQVGELHVDGVAAPVLRLRYNFNRSLLLVAHADRLLVLSSAGMLQEFDNADAALGAPEAAQLEALFAADAGFAARFGLGKRRVAQRLTVSADYLALGYGQFIPQLAGLRMELNRDGWHGFLALNPGDAANLEFGPLWQAMPMGASACAAVPLSRAALAPVYARLGDGELLAPELAAQLVSPAALCWYGSSRLHTPLLVTQLTGANPALDAQLAQAFEGMVGAYEENADGGRFPVMHDDTAANPLWTRIVGSSYGLHDPGEEVAAESLTNDHYFRIALARHGNTLLFSLDDELVKQGLATLDQRFPPLAEQLPKDAAVPLYLAADSLATLLEKETLESLPDDLEALFRNAAQSHLLPKLHALGEHKRYALALPPSPKVIEAWTWVPLEWSEL